VRAAATRDAGHADDRSISWSMLPPVAANCSGLHSSAAGLAIIANFGSRSMRLSGRPGSDQHLYSAGLGGRRRRAGRLALRGIFRGQHPQSEYAPCLCARVRPVLRLVRRSWPDADHHPAVRRGGLVEALQEKHGAPAVKQQLAAVSAYNGALLRRCQNGEVRQAPAA
jgi:hypothetical protein